MSVVSDRTPDSSGSRQRRSGPRFGVRGSAARGAWRRWNEADVFTAPARSEWPLALRRARTVGLILLGVQLLVFGWWSTVLVNRYALTWDFSAYNQATYLIAHGHLNPVSTPFAFPFWQNNGEFIFWPLAIFEAIWPHIVTLKWLQDIAIVGAEAVAFGWICEIAAKRSLATREVAFPVALVTLGALMLVGEPWLLWTISFDAHPEAFSVPFLILAARDLYRGRRTVWLWVGCTIVCGAVPASYVGALGVSAILSGRRWWRQGVVIAVLGFGWLSFLHAIHAAQGSGIDGLYGPLLAGNGGSLPANASSFSLIKALFEHPGRFADVLWANKTNLWATIAPVGAIGLLWLPALAPAALILAEGGLTRGLGFSFPSFQNAALVPLVAVGTIALLAMAYPYVTRAARWLMPAILVLLAGNTVAWAAIWIPQASSRWLVTPSGSAAVLAKLHAKMSPNDEVIVSQGIAGGFSDRRWLFTLVSSDMAVPVRAHHVWVIFAPTVGIETAPVSGIYADMRELSADPAMHLAVARHGIWAFEWTPPKHTSTLTLGHPTGANVSLGAATWNFGLGLTKPNAPARSVAPAWALVGAAGRASLRGPTSDWTATSNGKPGYVVDEAYWREPIGSYVASVSLAVSGRANVEVWDVSGGEKLLSRRVVASTHGKTTVSLKADLTHLRHQHLFGGWGPWAAVPKAPLPGDTLEIRVWSRGGNNRVTVYSASVQ